MSHYLESPTRNLYDSSGDLKSYSRLGSNLSQIETEAFKDTLDSMRKSLEHQKAYEKAFKKEQQRQEQHELELAQKKLSTKKTYQKELLKQINEQAEQKAKENQKRKEPAISYSMHGYPSIPMTPEEVKNQRKLNQIKKNKEDLDKQLQERQLRLDHEKRLEKEKDQKNNQDALKALNEENEFKRNKKSEQREMLLHFWDQACEAKKLQKSIEEVKIKGILEEPSYEKTIHETTHETQQDTYEEPIQRTEPKPLQPSGPKQVKARTEKTIRMSPVLQGLSVREKALLLKSQLETKAKKAYQNQIKKIIEKGKNSRSPKSLSKNPIEELTKKKFQKAYSRSPSKLNRERSFSSRNPYSLNY